MFCGKCGKQVSQNARFCGYCGSQVKYKRTCPVCGGQEETEMAYCTSCGARMDAARMHREAAWWEMPE